jgi:hypothetical protein
VFRMRLQLLTVVHISVFEALVVESGPNLAISDPVWLI